MATPDTIDFERLLAPVSEKAPAGQDIEGEKRPVRKDCKTARDKESRPLVDDGDGSTAKILEIPDARSEWRHIATTAQDLLATRSKDLDLAAWLTEALVRLHGFAGLRDGFRLARELLERYGTDCFPRLDDEEGVDAGGLGALSGAGKEGLLLVPMRNVPITQGSQELTTWHFDLAESPKSPALSTDDFARSGTETDPTVLRTTAADLAAAATEFDLLVEVADNVLGGDGLPDTHIRKQFDRCREVLKFLKVEIAPPQSEDPGQADSGNDAGASGAGTTTVAEPVLVGMDTMTRQEAFRTIAQLAKFFRTTEPHSPVSYALERIVRWGDTPLPELLEELVEEDLVRANIFRLTGIRTDSDSQTEEG